MKKDIKEIHNWFARNIQEYHYDQLTLACEDCAYDLHHEQWLDDESHPLWEIGIEWFDKQFPGYE